MNQNPVYLIPFDFSPVSESALKLGLDLANVHNGTVVLVHVTKSQSEKLEAKLKFKEFISGLSQHDQAKVKAKAIVGDLYEDIAKAGELLDASLIVMGTHGAKGFQKVFGSHAVKLISNCDTPFLITQGKKTLDSIKTIVMPFSYQKKSIQIATFAAKMAKKFSATIHLVGYHDKDELLESHTITNQKVVKKMFNENNVSFVEANIPKGSDFDSELMKYANEVNADLMAAGYYKEGVITNPNSFIQMMIENELNLPLLTVNAEGLTVSGSHSVATGY